MEYTGNDVKITQNELLSRAMKNVERQYLHRDVPDETYNVVRLQDGRMVQVPDAIMGRAERFIMEKYSKTPSGIDNNNDSYDGTISNQSYDPNFGLGTQYTRNDEDSDNYDENPNETTRDFTEYSPRGGYDSNQSGQSGQYNQSGQSNGQPDRFDEFNRNIIRELEGEYSNNYMDNVRGNETNITTSGSVFAPLDENKEYNTGSEIYHNPEHDNSVLDNDPNYRKFREIKQREREHMMRGSPSKYTNDEEECDCEECMNSHNENNNMVTDDEFMKHMEMVRNRMRSNDNNYNNLAKPKEESSALMMIVLVILLIGLGFAISKYI